MKFGGILFWYVLRSFAVPALICFLGLCALFLLFTSFDLIGAVFDPKAAVDLRMAWDFLGGTLSTYLEWLLPAVFLLATLYTMWQFCRHSELTAMRAGGIGMTTVVAPILIVAAIAAVLSFLNTEYYRPAAATRAVIIKDSDFRDNGRTPRSGVGFVAPDGSHIWLFGTFDPQRPDRPRDVQITFFRDDGSRDVSYSAPRAEYLDGVWWLRGGVTGQWYDELDNVILPPEGVPARVSEKALYAVTEKPLQILAQNSDADTASIALRKANRKLRDQTGLTTRQKNEDSYATYSHYAAPVSILLVTLFAIPAGIASGRQSVFRGILLAISLFLAYYLITALAMWLSGLDIIKPALAAALPSILFGIAAIWLFRRQR